MVQVRFIFIIIILCYTCISCARQEDQSTPAQAQIDEYTKQIEDCRQAKQQQSKKNKTSKTTSDNGLNSTQQVTLSLQVAPDDIILGGNPNSSVVFIEYFSPTCPHCAYYKKEILPKIREKYVDTDKILYVVREFIANKLDLEAAILARCNGNKDSFFQFTSILLEQQDSWINNRDYKKILKSIGQLGGVSEEQYVACLHNEKLAEVLIANTKLVAMEPRFNGTPAFFINGVQFTAPYTVDYISKAIDQALEATHSTDTH